MPKNFHLLNTFCPTPMLMLIYLHLFFSVNFSISMFNIASLASPVNVVKKAGNEIISNVFLKVFEVCV